VVTNEDRDADYYRARLARFRSLSHLTVEVKVYPRGGTAADRATVTAHHSRMVLRAVPEVYCGDILH
jgi:hypothetical protein